MPKIQSLTTYFALNASNDTSQSGVTDLVTGQPIMVPDLDVGVYFDLTEAEANQLSYTTAGTLHQGRYRRVLVDSGATAANVQTGTLAYLTTVAKGVNCVTSYDKALSTSLCLGVFLNAVTPGNYGFIQESGDANVLGNGTIGSGNSVGQYVASTTGGTINTSSGAGFGITTVGVATSTPTASTLSRVELMLPRNAG